MTTYVVTEGRSGVAVLLPLIEAAKISDFHALAAGGKSAATSLARSISISRQSPVAVIVDADTSDAASIREQQLIFRDLTNASSLQGPCRLFLAIPTLEEALFPDAKTFEKIYYLHLTDGQRHRFLQDKISVVKEYLTKLQEPAKVTHGTLDSAAAERGFGRPLLQDLLGFMRNPTTASMDRTHKLLA